MKQLNTTLTRFIFIILVCYVKTLRSFSESKCCEFGEIFTEFNGTYYCTEDTTKRLQLNVNQTGFISQNTSGQCVEVIRDVFVFNVSDGVILPLEQSNEKIFPKCCPMGYVYNSIIHSCEERPHSNHSFMEESALRIGLPNCRVIVDYELNGVTDYEYGLQDSSLLIHRRNRINEIGSYCIDRTHKDSFVLRECKDSIAICNEWKCFKKCCPDGQSFIGGDTCYDTYKYGLNISKWANVIEKTTGKIDI